MAKAHLPRSGLSARAWCTVLIGVSMASLAGSGALAQSASGKTHMVLIEQMRFTPEKLTANRGDRILWVNKDLFPHTATGNAAEFDSGSIEANGSWSYVAEKPGAFPYVCAFHPTMKGMLTVR